MHIINEYYHIYNRGAHKALIFQERSDYERFVALLYVANDSRPIFPRWSNENFWQLSRDGIVDIFAYCLMPNHFHLGLVEKTQGGISKFVRKVCTAYSMYYNKKYNHSGTIIQGKYKTKHINNDDYLQYLVDYIHLNPFGIEEPELMNIVKPEFRAQAIEYSKKYEFSSYRDYLGEKRIQGVILVQICRGRTS